MTRSPSGQVRRRRLNPFLTRFVPDLRSRLELLLLEERENPAGTITGLVFNDVNVNALYDPSTTAPTAAGQAGLANNTYATPGDTPIAGVTVLAFDPSGTQVGQATTGANGVYSLDTGATTGPYRVQFVNIPPGTVTGPVGAAGGVSGPTVQFVQDGGATGVNLGVVYPGATLAGTPTAPGTTDANPVLYTAVYKFGNPLDPANPNANTPVIVSFPYNAGASVTGTDANGNPTIPTTVSGTNKTDPVTVPASNVGSQLPLTTPQVTIPYSQVGTVLGMGFNPATGQLYAAEYMKRYTGFGPGATGDASTGAIYAINAPAPGSTGNVSAASVLVDLGALTGPNYRAGYAETPANQNAPDSVPLAPSYVTDGMVRTLGTDANGNFHPVDQGWNAVGTMSLGGLDVLPDGSRLFVMNLYDRQLYSVAINPDGTAGAITPYSLPVPASVTGVTGNTPLGDLRPFAVQYYNGKIYVGAVNSAESTIVYQDLGAAFNGVHKIAVQSWDPSKLRAYVFVFDPATNTFTQQPVVDFSLNYARGYVDAGNGSTTAIPAAWNPWTSVLPQSTPNFPTGIPQGAFPQPMLSSLAFDSNGNLTLGLRDRAGDQFPNFAPADPTKGNRGTQDYFYGIPAGDILHATLTPTGYVLEENGTGPTGDGQGKEFFYQDNQATKGAVHTPDSASNRHDEVSLGAVLQLPGSSQVLSTSFNPNPNADQTNRGGIRWYDTTDGTLKRAYELYYAPNGGQSSGGQFALFAKASGVGELVAQTALPPVEIGDRVWFDTDRDGVQDAGEAGIAGVQVQLLNASGAVIATATTDANGYYLFSSRAAGSAPGAVYGLNLSPTAAYKLRIANTAGQTPVANLRLTKTNATSPADPDAVDNDATQVGANADVDVPAGSVDPAGRANTTFDFGFTDRPNLVIGDTVWYDANNDGLLNNGETGIQGITVKLIDTNGGAVIGTQTTDANGVYHFTGLNPGRYVVQIVVDPASGLVSSSGNGASAALPGPFEPASTTSDVNNQDHGTNVGGGVIQAHPITLVDPLSGTLNPDDYLGRTGVANLRQDFGLWKPLAIGDTVWIDANNNGLKDATETGLDGVTVRLYSGGVQLRETTTMNGGVYHFEGLFPGTYTVKIVAPAGYRSSTGNGLTTAATGPFEPAPATDINDQDHGTTEGGQVIAARPITLVDAFLNPAGNPDAYKGAAGVANLRQDFGLWTGTVPLALGDTVWNDVNNDGVRATNGSEPGIPGVTVQLLQNGAVIATQTTDANGKYLFTGLSAGTYQVNILTDVAEGWISSTGAGNSGAATGPFEPAPATDNNDEDHGTTTGPVVGGPKTFLLISARSVTLTDPSVALNPDASASGPGTANLHQDFGLWRPLSLGNLLWEDTNNDGVFDPATELNGGQFAGTPVQLLDGAGNVVRTTNVNAQGGYLFTYLLPGTYQVRVALPAGAGFVYSSSGNGVGDLTSRVTNPPQPTGPYEPAPGTTGDSTDHGTKAGNFVLGPKVNLQVGAAPTGEAPTLGGIADPARDVDSDLTQDLGFIRIQPPQLAGPSISGHVYIDSNVNGQRDAGEPPIPGTLLTITGTLDGGGTYSATTRTDKTGFYAFNNLPDGGTYVITETQPPGQLFNGFTLPGSLGGTAGNDVISAIRVNIADNGVNYDFSEFQPMTVYGNVYFDANRNGVRDDPAVEYGIPNTTITISGTAFAGTPFARPLQASDSQVGLVVTTDSLGQYVFPALPPGLYNLNETQPAGYDDGLESSLDPGAQQPTVGNDVFTGVGPGSTRFRGPFNFGEVRPGEVVPPNNGPDQSKRNFIGTPSVQPADTTPLPIGGGTVVPIPDVVLNQASGILAGNPVTPTVTVVGAGVGVAPLVRVFDYSRGFESLRFTAYESSFLGGVRTAVGDLNGDGIPDIVTVPGQGGGPVVKVFDGADGHLITSFNAFEASLRSGLFVTLGDVTGDNTPDIVLGSDVGGGPRVSVFDGKTFTLVKDFFAFDEASRSGVRVAVADFNGDGKADIAATTGAGTKTATLVRVFDASTGAVLKEFAPYGPAFTGGAFIAVGDVNNDGIPDLITGVDQGDPAVYAFSGKDGGTLFGAYAFAPGFQGGVRVAAADVNGDGKDDVIVTPGQGGGPIITALDAATGGTLDQFFDLNALFRGGLYVSATPFKK